MPPNVPRYFRIRTHLYFHLRAIKGGAAKPENIHDSLFCHLINPYIKMTTNIRDESFSGTVV